MTVVHAAKKSVITVVGFALVALGIVLMPLPGPGLLVSVAGFAVLATEYTWARRALDTTKARAIQSQKQVAASRLTLLGQILAGICLIGTAVAFILKSDLPFASTLTSVMLTIGGAVLITSAVLARRRYAHPVVDAVTTGEGDAPRS